MEATPEEPHKDAAQNPKTESTSEDIKPRLPSTPAEPPRKKKEDKKRDERYVEQFMRAINTASSAEEKIKIASEKYAHMVDDNKKMQFFIKQSEKRHAMMVKEKEQLQHEYNKTVLVKSKLENLCRELQKQNKAIKDESLHKIREEEERRKETQAKFQHTLGEISSLLQQNNDKNAKLREDNINMTDKFKSVMQQYQLREEQIEKLSKQLVLEQQLAEARIAKAGLEHQAEREGLLGEMEALKMTVAQFRAKIVELQGVETGLRSQLAVYTDKYDEFQNALVKSNQVFGGFKEEMEKMAKKIKSLEKESLSWKQRWERSQSALLELCGERQAREAANRQLASMQSLCRTLQAERSLLLSTLKQHNIERPPLPAHPTPPPPNTASDDKVDAMAANCAQLRQSLAHLQSQLNTLTSKQLDKPTDEQPKSDKPKKSKTKKAKKPKETAIDTKESTESDNPKEATDIESNANDDKGPIQVNQVSGVQEIDSQIDSPIDNPIASHVDNVIDNQIEQIDIDDEKVDDKTLENLIQAISNANIDLCDLEVGNDDDVTKVLNSQEISNESPKITEIVDENVPKDESIKVDNPKTEEVVDMAQVNGAVANTKSQSRKKKKKIQSLESRPVLKTPQVKKRKSQKHYDPEFEEECEIVRCWSLGIPYKPKIDRETTLPRLDENCEAKLPHEDVDREIDLPRETVMSQKVPDGRNHRERPIWWTDDIAKLRAVSNAHRRKYTRFRRLRRHYRPLNEEETHYEKELLKTYQDARKELQTAISKSKARNQESNGLKDP